MESPVKESKSGWTGRMDAPRTIERKRKGRDTDRIIMPTPPREHAVSHLPTPESVRRPSKSTSKVEKTEPVQTTQMLPTPQTLPRQPRKAIVPLSTSSATDEEVATPPSPSGHTTFFLSSSSTSGSRGEKISRRRPGLTFAQQMGLLSTGSGGQSCGQASRPGIGVGMGGSRSGGHKKDQVVWGHLAEPVALGGMEEANPFITKSTLRNNLPKAPGQHTIHQPRSQLEDEDTSGVAELKYRHPSPSHLADPTTGLLTPPPTKVQRGIRTIPKDPAEEARKREKKDRMRRMMDVESNPFLVKPGESSRSKTERRVSPAVDETQPTVTYVFRGAKKVFANPFYPSDAPFPHALLDPEDEDYEPHPNPKPRLLWPSPPPASKRINLDAFDSPPGVSPPSSPITTPKRRLFAKPDLHVDSDQDEDEDEEEDEEPATPTVRRLFMPSTIPAKRSAPEEQEEGKREEKKYKGMRL